MGPLVVEALKKLRPDAACMRCGRAYTGSLERTVMCVRPAPHGGYCGGRITWRGSPEDWTECPQCSGTGINHGQTCTNCHGDAWLMGKL
jgi:DnaJ-class molecular chaperone